MSRLRRRLRHDDRGTSLVELLVTMLIATIVISATVTVASALQRTSATVLARQDQTQVGANATARVAATLRFGVDPTVLSTRCTSGCSTQVFESGDGWSMVFYSNLDNTGSANGALKVTYSIATSGTYAGQLVETVQKPTLSGGGFTYCNTATPSCAVATVTTRTLTPQCTVSRSAPVFRYFDKTQTDLSPTGSVLSATSLAQTLSVEVTLAVQRVGAVQAPATTYVQRITLPYQQLTLTSR